MLYSIVFFVLHDASIFFFLTDSLIGQCHVIPGYCFNFFRSAPLQPRHTALTQMNGGTGIFSAVQSPVCVQHVFDIRCKCPTKYF